MIGLALVVIAAAAPLASAPLQWASPARYRVLLDVDPGRGRRPSNAPASVDVDFPAALRARQAEGVFDESTVEVVAYDDGGRPRVFDGKRDGRERWLLPWRIDHDYPLAVSHLHFVVPDERTRRVAVYFDTAGSGRGQPQRFRGLVGDGDFFAEAYGRRARAASAHDAWVDLDGDGDLDLVKGGTEPFLTVFENVGGNRLVERGRLSSGGAPLVFPSDDGHRAWLAPAFVDWDGDGDQDLFLSFDSGPNGSRVIRYENVTAPGGPLTFADRGPLTTVSGKPLSGRLAFVDWDGDGLVDVLSMSDSLIAFHRNLGGSRGVAQMQIADGEYLTANGQTIQVEATSADAADLDGDGPLDLVVGTEEGRVFFFANTGTRTRPVLAAGRLLFFFDYMDAKAGVKVADFDGDGLLDIAVGRYWERTHDGEQPRVYGRLFKNVGTHTAPRFEARDAADGAPYTEGFHPVDALRQNGVRAVDWDGDGRADLVVGDTDGFVWLFRNTTDALFPVFAPGERLRAAGAPIKVYGEEPEARLAGYARVDVADWNGDGRKDLVVADGRGWVWVFLNVGTDARPVLGRGRRLAAAGRPIDGTSRGSVLVRDWNGDGLPDLVFAMVGEGPTTNADWPPRHADATEDRGFLYYRNVGTRTAPVLAAPKWIKAGPDAVEIDLTRPNLGDFVDWDGDGRKDFLACEFENNCRVWRRTDAGGPGAKPVFAGPVEGEVVLSPWTDETISGLDARDWNGDGDVDLLTGQGHGGSSVRFFERDYLENTRHGTGPVVTIDREPDPVAGPR
jgi:VCBS repeat protein